MCDQPEVGANLIVPIQTGHVGMIKTTRLGCRIVELVADVLTVNLIPFFPIKHCFVHGY